MHFKIEKIDGSENYRLREIKTAQANDGSTVSILDDASEKVFTRDQLVNKIALVQAELDELNEVLEQLDLLQ